MGEHPKEEYALRSNPQDRERLRQEARQLGAERFLLDRDTGYDGQEGPTEDIILRQRLDFFTDEPREADDGELARTIFAEVFVEGYRGEKDRPRFEVRPSGTVLEYIDSRTDGDPLLRLRVAEQSLARCYLLLNRASETLRGTFSREEEAALVEAIVGFPCEPFDPASFPEHVEWAMGVYPPSWGQGVEKGSLMEKRGRHRDRRSAHSAGCPV